MIRTRATVARQALAVTLLLAAALGATAGGASWAPAADVGAALTLAGLGVVALALRVRARWEARDLIAHGEEHLELPPVQRERRRLLSDRNRRSLAASIERMLAQAAAPPPRIAPAGTRPLFDVRVICAVSDDLHAIGALLRAGAPSARGVALVESLVTGGGSELYGHELEPLREQLRRVRYLLEQVVLTKS